MIRKVMAVSLSVIACILVAAQGPNTNPASPWIQVQYAWVEWHVSDEQDYIRVQYKIRVFDQAGVDIECRAGDSSSNFDVAKTFFGDSMNNATVDWVWKEAYGYTAHRDVHKAFIRASNRTIPPNGLQGKTTGTKSFNH